MAAELIYIRILHLTSQDDIIAVRLFVFCVRNLYFAFFGNCSCTELINAILEHLY
jgi:hypothetical protein